MRRILPLVPSRRLLEVEFDGGADAFEVVADLAGQVDEGRDAAAGGGGDPAAQVRAGLVHVDGAVQVSQLLFEFPGSPWPVAEAAHSV